MCVASVVYGPTGRESSGSGFTQGMVWRAEPGGGATVGIFPDKFLAFLPGSLRCQMVERGHKVMSGILIIELFQLQNTKHCRRAALVGTQQQHMTRSPGGPPQPSGECVAIYCFKTE